MSKLYKSPRGFAVLEIMVVIAAVVLIAIVGSVVLSHYNKSDATLILQRQQAIDKHIHDLTIQNYGSLGTSLNKRGYLTPSLYLATQSLISSYTGGDFSSNPAYSKLICVGQIPSSFTYGAVTVGSSGDTATIPVNVFVPGSTTATPYTADWVKTNGTWQLNNAACS